MIFGLPSFNPALIVINNPGAPELLVDQADEQITDQSNEDLTSQ